MSIDVVNLKYKNIWLLIGYMLIIFVVYQTLTSNPVSVGVKISDKFLHTVGYFVLMGWFMQIFHQHLQRLLWALFFVGMGIGMEFLQELGGIRFFEVNDMLANGLGVLIAWALSVTKFSCILMYFEEKILKV